MGFFSKVFKGIKKAVKGVAKGVKKVGKAVWKGVKNVAKGVGKAVSKLGPIAMLAANFIPGVGTFFSSMWSTFGSTMGAWAGANNAFVKAVGAMGKGAFNGVNWVKGTARSITSGISNAFTSMGEGNFTQGIYKFADGVAEAATGKGGMAGIQASQDAAIQAAVDAAGTFNVKALQDVTLSPTANQFGTTIKPGSLVGEVQLKPALDFGLTETPAFSVTGQAPAGITEGVRLPEFKADPAKFFGDDSITRAATVSQEQFIKEGKKSLAKRALSAASTGLELLAKQDQLTPYIPGYTSPETSVQATGQIGSLGSGSAGGGFLSQDQVASYNQYWHNSLGLGRRVGGTA